MGKLIITTYQNQLYGAYYVQDVLEELRVLKEESILGNIYIGKVRDIVKNIDAAFVEYQSGEVCYYSLRDNLPLKLNNSLGDKPLVAGDEILIQITKEAIKTKAPTGSSTLQISGEYVVLLYNDPQDFKVKISHKFQDKEQAKTLKHACSTELKPGYSCILRTKAQQIPQDDILCELRALMSSMEELLSKAPYRKTFSKLNDGQSQIQSLIKDIGIHNIDTITTDIESIYQNIEKQLSLCDRSKLHLYAGTMPLYGIYSLDRDIRDLTRTQVWLKSGAYLVIEPTEALTVIDVNTGKSLQHKNKNSHILQVNLEAAKEILRQLHLRNISGIIIVDFINMENKEDNDLLLSTMTRYASMDSVATQVVDMTSLGLVELTRKKIRASLSQQIHEN